MRLIFTVASIFTAILLSGPVAGEVPHQAHFNGYLTNAIGEAVDCSDAIQCVESYDLTFRLYDSKFSESPLWEEPHEATPFYKGSFHIILGSTNPLDPGASGNARFLGISINGDAELMPRLSLSSSFFALRASVAENAMDAAYLMGQSPGDFEPVGSAQQTVTEHELNTTHLTSEQLQAQAQQAVEEHELGTTHLTLVQLQAEAQQAVEDHELGTTHLTSEQLQAQAQQAVEDHELGTTHLTLEQHQALTGGPDSLADAQHAHAETEPSLPAGMIAFFPGSACPPGWAEYAPLRGRIVVGVSSEDTVGAQVGDALGDQGSRTITEVPFHSHLIDPPDASSTTSNASHTHSMNHTHGVNPPNTGTSGGGAHTHNLQDGVGIGDGLVGVNVGGGGHPGVTNQSGNGSALNTTSSGNHSHTVDIGNFTSGGSSSSQTGGGDSAHNHSVNIPSFVSFPTGATAVDVTMPYLQLLACQLQ